MSNVKSLTRHPARYSPYSSEDSNSSIDSITELAKKIGKFNKFEDVKGRYDASAEATDAEVDPTVLKSTTGVEATSVATPRVAATPQNLSECQNHPAAIFTEPTPGVGTPASLETNASLLTTKPQMRPTPPTTQTQTDAGTMSTSSPSDGTCMETKPNSVQGPQRDPNRLLNYFSVAVANRYGILAEQTDDNMDTDGNHGDAGEDDALSPTDRRGTQRSDAEEHHTQQPQAKPAKPTALCFPTRIEKHYSEFRRKLNEISTNYFVQFSKDSTLVYYKSMTDYKRFIEKFGQVLPFYTYTPRNEKTSAYLIKGLHGDVECEDLKLELTELALPPKTIVKFSKTRYPIFMITVDKKVTLKDLQTKARFLQRTRAYFEPYYNKKEVIQCKKCQQWVHATANCYMNVVKCVKCAGSHRSFECDKEREVPAVCCNCGKDHPASSTDCEVYQTIVEERKAKARRAAPTPKQKYVAAPAPTTNAWENRKEFPPTSGLAGKYAQLANSAGGGVRHYRRVAARPLIGRAVATPRPIASRDSPITSKPAGPNAWVSITHGSRQRRPHAPEGNCRNYERDKQNYQFKAVI